MKVVLVMLVVTAALLIYQTTSPVRITENMIFSYKHKMLLGEAETVASSLSSSQNLTSQGAEEIMSVLGTRDMGQVVITDGSGVVLYSSNPSVSPVGSCTLYPEIVSALRGNDAFRCSFTGDAFVSRGAIPVMFGGDTIGCVYMVEIDSEQAELLTSIQNNAVRTSIITVLVSLVLYIVFGLVVIRKNESLLQSIRRVQDGDYEHRVEVKGKDEFAVLANEFNALTDRLQQTEQIRRQFVSDASHELRTPLAAMRLLSDSILQNDMDQDTIREFVQDISGEADRLTRMTSKLLNLTALDSRQFTPTETEPVNLGECCKKAVRMLGPYAKEMGAVRNVFGDAMPMISSTKSLTGHSLGAAGAQESIYCLLMMKNNFAAKSAHIENLDPEFADMPILQERHDGALQHVMSNSFGFGGTNATVIFSKV